MPSEEKKQAARKSGRLTFRLSLLAFAAYIFNVLVGKAGIAYGWKVWRLDNVGEFLLLLLASTLLTVAAMQREEKAGPNLNENNNTEGTE